MRLLLLLTGLILVPASGVLGASTGFEVSAEFTIVGEGGAEEVEIGPAGGQVPYSLFIETDPVGTPNNFGFALAGITIDTDTGVIQQPATAFDPLFDQIPRSMKQLGIPRGDDIESVVVFNCGDLFCEFDPMIIPNLGQSAPQLLAYGELIIPPAPVGEAFHASILIDPDIDNASVAQVFRTETRDRGFPLTGPPGLLGNTLTINVVPEPSTVLLMVGAFGILLCRRGSIAVQRGAFARSQPGKGQSHDCSIKHSNPRSQSDRFGKPVGPIRAGRIRRSDVSGGIPCTPASSRFRPGRRGLRWSGRYCLRRAGGEPRRTGLCHRAAGCVFRPGDRC